MAARVRSLEQIVFPIMPPVDNQVTFIQQRPMKNFAVGSTPAGFYKTFGAHFADNDVSGVPVGKIVEWRKGDATTVISSQGDSFVYYPSGRLKDVSVTTFYPSAIAASGTDTLKGYAKTGTWNNSSWATTAAISARDIRGEITISGTTYTLRANNEVTRATFIRQTRSGPLMARWEIWGEFRNGILGSSTAQGDVWGIMYVTFFSDGTYSVWLKIMNGRAGVPSSGLLSVTDYKIKDYVGPTTLFDRASAFTFYPGSPVWCCDTDGLHYYSGTSVDECVVGFPTLTLADPTTTGLYDSKNIWWHPTTPTMRAAMSTSGSPSSYAPNTTGDYGDPNSGGGSDFIGPMTEFDARFIILGDWNNLRASRINALNNTSQHSFLDFTTAYPANLSNGTSYSGLRAANVNFSVVDCGYPFAGAPPQPGGGDKGVDGSHLPNLAWGQYLATGEEWWLDEMHDQAVGFALWMNPGNNFYQRNPTINSAHSMVILLSNSTRSLAWNLRNFGDTHHLTPDSHPMKQYLLDWQTSTYNAMADYMSTPFQSSNALILGVFDGGEDSGLGTNSGWMHDYLMFPIGNAVRRGVITTSNNFIQQHVIKWIIGRGLACPFSSSQYQFGIPAGQNAINYNSTPPGVGMTYPTTWADVWTGTGSGVGGAANLQWSIMAPQGNASCPVSGIATLETNPPTTTNNYLNGLCHSYPNIQQCAMAIGQLIGLAGASTVYNYITTYEATLGIAEGITGWAGAGARLRVRLPA